MSSVRGIGAIVSVVVLLVGAAGALGIVPGLAVSTTTTPRLTAHLNATSNELTVDLAVHIYAVPVGEMNLTRIVVDWGGQVVIYTNVPTGEWGTYEVDENYSFAEAGTYSILAVVHARIGSYPNGTAYLAGTAPISVTVPNGGNTSGGGSVTSLFSWSATGLTASFADQSIAEGGATVTGEGWTFGDGGTARGASPTHTYASAGTYLVTETVTASTAGGAVTGTSSLNITVTSTGNGGGCGSACGGPGLPPRLSLNLATLSLMGFGASLLAVMLLGGDPRFQAGAVLAATGGAAILGFALGGL